MTDYLYLVCSFCYLYICTYTCAIALPGRAAVGFAEGTLVFASTADWARARRLLHARCLAIGVACLCERDGDDHQIRWGRRWNVAHHRCTRRRSRSLKRKLRLGRREMRWSCFGDISQSIATLPLFLGSYGGRPTTSLRARRGRPVEVSSVEAGPGGCPEGAAPTNAGWLSAATTSLCAGAALRHSIGTPPSLPLPAKPAAGGTYLARATRRALKKPGPQAGRNTGGMVANGAGDVDRRRRGARTIYTSAPRPAARAPPG